MVKTREEIEKLFIPHLHAEEEFRWIGEPKRNRWHLRLPSLLLSLVWLLPVINLICYQLRWVFVYSLAIVAIYLIDYSMIDTLNRIFAQELGLPAIILIFYRGEFIAGIMAATTAVRLNNYLRTARDIEKPSLSGLPRIWERTYYAITNQRILIFEQTSIHEYSLMLMADAVVGKPKNSESTIYLYNRTNPTGQLPEPVFELKGIVEEDAQAAYEILRRAREEALEDRAREMGIE